MNIYNNFADNWNPNRSRNPASYIWEYFLRRSRFFLHICLLVLVQTLYYILRVQLRMNAKRNCYVGFLAGLGYTVESETKAGRPIYPEYDAEVDFDVRLLTWF